MSTWQKVKIGDFLYEREGKYKPNAKEVEGLLRIEKIDFKGNFHIGAKPSKTNLILIKKGDLVISGINVAKGAMGIYTGEEDVVATIHYSSYTFDKTKINLGYFKRFLKSPEFIRLLNEQVKGGIKTEIKPKHILPLEISLPDIVTQNQIVSNFEKIENDISELDYDVRHQQNLLKRLKQTILQEAIEGKLTSKWREQNSDIEPASILLEKIQAEKEKLIKDKKIKKQKSLPPITDDEKSFEIPESWEWCRLGDVSVKIGSGSTPKGSNYSAKGYPFLRSQNIYDEGLVYKDIKYITEEVHQSMRGTRVVKNDLLLNITGGSLGRCAYVPASFSEGNINQHVCIIRALTVYRKFLHKVVLSPFFQNLIFGYTTGAGREGLPKYNLEKFVVAIPPIKEQKEIVSIIEKLFAICDQLEEQINSSKENVDMLMKTVLKEAFEHGEG
ncbi:restriction endonuclease subunit S [Francisella sp. SYW-2]|uniref:restriction endonuclease subunit S n=1 Tax=Francisella sp. SYW-2 TaxID=2610886 RepID=UPI001CD18B3E|nr:restriction endonuclease subunit S [Francisella sp. SYW-2]